jgi:hypothetical protein
VRLSGALEETLSISTIDSEANEYIELVLWLFAHTDPLAEGSVMLINSKNGAKTLGRLFVCTT